MALTDRMQIPCAITAKSFSLSAFLLIANSGSVLFWTALVLPGPCNNLGAVKSNLESRGSFVALRFPPTNTQTGHVGASTQITGKPTQYMEYRKPLRRAAPMGRHRGARVAIGGDEAAAK